MSPFKYNLKTTFGRCLPLPIKQDCDAPSFAPSPIGALAVLRYTRPPLRERGCCSGDDGTPIAEPYFDVELVNVGVGSEDGESYFSSEDELFYIAQEY